MFLQIVDRKVKKKKFRPIFFVEIVILDLSKNSLKDASDNALKNLAKITKNNKLLVIFYRFQGLNNSSYQIYEANFYQVFF